MQRRFRIAAAVNAAALTASGLGLLAPAAHAATGSTDATFTITGGVISITVPASTVNLGTVAAGSLTASGSLGDTSVSDQRGALPATWTLTASSTSFTTGGATAPETVTNSNVSYLAGPSTSVTPALAGVFTPVPTSVSLGSPQTAGAFAGTGVNVVHWDPTIAFVLSPNQVAGTYTGTITQSAA
jgi:hypothetical protein